MIVFEVVQLSFGAITFGVHRVSDDRKAIGAHTISHEIWGVWGHVPRTDVRRARRSDLRRLGGVEILGMHGLEGIVGPLGPSAGSTASQRVRAERL